MLVGRAHGDVRVVSKAPAVRRHPKKPRRIYASFVQHHAARDSSGMLDVANLAAKRTYRLSPFGYQKHTATVAIDRESISAIQNVAHLRAPRDRWLHMACRIREQPSRDRLQ
jgi:hypothetical protein